MFGTTVSLVELIWVLMFSYGVYKTGRSLKYTYRVRLYWEAHDSSVAMNDKTDVYTTDRLRSAFLRFGSVFMFWLAGVTSMTIPAGEPPEPVYIGVLPSLFLVIAGGLLITDAIYSERTLRALLRHDAPGKVCFSDIQESDHE